MEEQFIRTARLIGGEAVEKLAKSKLETAGNSEAFRKVSGSTTSNSNLAKVDRSAVLPVLAPRS